MTSRVDRAANGRRDFLTSCSAPAIVFCRCLRSLLTVLSEASFSACMFALVVSSEAHSSRIAMAFSETFVSIKEKR